MDTSLRVGLVAAAGTTGAVPPRQGAWPVHPPGVVSDAACLNRQPSKWVCSACNPLCCAQSTLLWSLAHQARVTYPASQWSCDYQPPSSSNCPALSVVAVHPCRTHNWGTESDPEFKGYHNGNSDPRGYGERRTGLPACVAAVSTVRFGRARYHNGN